ncbi:hypothetical protein QUF70_09110 [Desulfobacterales bacterium HSG17]|nr:hypothetical protein [Desulfobacterales bacterium HSG17]
MHSITPEERAAFKIASEISDIALSKGLRRKNKLAILEALRDTLNDAISDLKLELPEKSLSFNGIKQGKM